MLRACRFLAECHILRIGVDPQIALLVSGDKSTSACLNRCDKCVALSCVNKVLGIDWAVSLKCALTLTHREVEGKSTRHQDSQRFQVVSVT